MVSHRIRSLDMQKSEWMQETHLADHDLHQNSVTHVVMNSEDSIHNTNEKPIYICKVFE